jgi:hypothetical protein
VLLWRRRLAASGVGFPKEISVHVCGIYEERSDKSPEVNWLPFLAMKEVDIRFSVLAEILCYRADSLKFY